MACPLWAPAASAGTQVHLDLRHDLPIPKCTDARPAIMSFVDFMAGGDSSEKAMRDGQHNGHKIPVVGPIGRPISPSESGTHSEAVERWSAYASIRRRKLMTLQHHTEVHFVSCTPSLETADGHTSVDVRGAGSRHHPYEILAHTTPRSRKSSPTMNGGETLTPDLVRDCAYAHESWPSVTALPTSRVSHFMGDRAAEPCIGRHEKSAVAGPSGSHALSASSTTHMAAVE
ncbi:hypothetical protein C8Q74DRAFT_1277682 [Fomes fomentarius]|nr:hypothetical protein C8Q74DRAFT_1277682 [Fomes fomentarius]